MEIPIQEKVPLHSNYSGFVGEAGGKEEGNI
jgi:hypothetical protein